MLFPEKKSALVRLSDTLKDGLSSCARLSHEFLELFSAHEQPYRDVQRLSDRALRGEISFDAAEHEIRAVLSTIPEHVSVRLSTLPVELDTQARTTILMSCFCLESYVNSLAYFLFEETDFLGLIRDGHRVSAEVLIEAIEQMSTRRKWETIAKLGGAAGFDRSRAPFQEFKYLFNFRDDHVHDKVVPISEDRSLTRYNGKLPDPVFGALDLSHALYAARTYWDMVQEIHRLIGVDATRFHRHYNLAPWRDDLQRRDLEKLAKQFAEALRPIA